MRLKYSNVWLVVTLLRDIVLIIIYVGIPLIIWDILKYSLEYLEVGDESVLNKKGILNTSIREIKLSSITSIDIYKSFFGNLLGYGNIRIAVANENSDLMFGPVNNPENLRRLLLTKTRKPQLETRANYTPIDISLL